MSLSVIIVAALLVMANGSTRVVGEDEIKQVVERFVHAQLDSMHDEIAIEYRGLPTRVLNVPQRARLRVVPDPNSRLRNNVMFPIEVFYENRVEHTFIVSLRIRTYGTVLMASERIPKRESAERIATTTETIETTTLPDDFISNSSALVGKRAKRMIRGGTVLTESMFENIPLIHQGDTVTLLVKSSSVNIRTQAVAREDGSSGDVVLIQKIGSRERLKARVLDKFTVELIAQN